MKITKLISLLVLMLTALVAYGQDEYWHQRVTLFDKLPTDSTSIVFLGNSITDGGEFAELFEMDNVLNRGIRSDNIRGVKKRLKQVTSGHPAKIFLLIGVNDIAGSSNVDLLAESYESLVSDIKTQTPATKLYLQGVFPFNNDFKRYKTLFGKEKVRIGLNKRIKQIAQKYGAEYIDLDSVLSDSAGKLKREYTNDGLHLLGPAYKIWVKELMPYVK